LIFIDEVPSVFRLAVIRSVAPAPRPPAWPAAASFVVSERQRRHFSEFGSWQIAGIPFAYVLIQKKENKATMG
jgi:hypothetical protein